MSLAEHLHPAAVLLRPESTDKWALLRHMSQALVDAGSLPQESLDAAVAALEERERSVSTGMEQGIAVPHAALEGLDRMVVGMALLPGGIDFEALDGQPSQVVVLILVPKAEKLMHLPAASATPASATLCWTPPTAPQPWRCGPTERSGCVLGECVFPTVRNRWQLVIEVVLCTEALSFPRIGEHRGKVNHRRSDHVANQAGL